MRPEAPLTAEVSGVFHFLDRNLLC